MDTALKEAESFPSKHLYFHQFLQGVCSHKNVLRVLKLIQL